MKTKLLYCLLIISFIIFAFSNIIVFATSEDVTNADIPIGEDDYSVQSSNEVIKTIASVVEAEDPTEVVNGTVTNKIQNVKIEIIKGDYIGEEFNIAYSLTYDINGVIEHEQLKVGDKITVQLVEDEEGNLVASIVDVVRYGNIITLVVLLIVSILIIAGKKGLRSIISLIYTVAILIIVLVLGINSGKNVYVMSILTVALISLGSYAIMFGINKKTLTAFLGTFLGILLSGIISLFFNSKAKMTGASMFYLEDSVGNIILNFTFKSLLFAQVLVATSGACMDMVVTIVEKLEEFKKENPDIMWKELIKKGIESIRDIVGSMINTLFLVFFATGIGSMLILVACQVPLYELLSYEVIIELIIVSISGTLGVIYSLPITAILYAFINKDRIVYRKETNSRLDGKRSLKL